MRYQKEKNSLIFPQLLYNYRKSFPSGHSSFSFAVFTFVFLYLAGKARSFANGNGRKISSAMFLTYISLILG